MNDKWKQDVEINPDALDVEWCKQASLFGEYCKQQAVARDKADRWKEHLEVLDAGLGLKIRANPAQYGLEKLTEAGVQAVILLDKEHQVASDQFNTARFELEVLTAAVRALDQKKAALENLVRLQGQSYFAGPTAPRELGKEWAADLERRNAMNKIKEARIVNRKGGAGK